MSRCLPLLLLVASCSGVHPSSTERMEDWLSRSWEHKLISSGDNFPTVNLRREHRADVALLLHAGFEPDSIAAHFGWSADELQERLDALSGAGLLDATRHRPTFPVLSVQDVRDHMPVPDALIDETVALIEGRLPEVQEFLQSTPGLRRLSFEDVSLLILSDVTLDNWQINAVERDFLGSERPERDGRRYYFALQEDAPDDSTEAFGIYGNQYRGIGPFTLGVYGNRRTGNPLNFATLDAEGLERLFGVRPDSVSVFKQGLLDLLVRASGDPDTAMPDEYRTGFVALGWMDGSRIAIPVLRPEDEEALDGIAALYADDLVALLRRHRSELVARYDASPYAGSVSIEEYLIWWYHVYYTAVTDRLAADGLLHIPESGITSYVLVPGD